MVVRAFQRPPKPRQCHCWALIIDGNIGPTRTPKCNWWQSWAPESITFTSDTLVRVRERRNKKESSLVVGIANISQTVLSQLALKTQRQPTKNQVPDSTYVKMTMCCPLGAETEVLLEPSQKVSQIFKRNGLYIYIRTGERVLVVGLFRETSPKRLSCCVS